MMDYQEAIELLKGEIKCSCYRNRGYCGICTIYSELERDKIIDACKCAISAMQELKMYKDGKLCLIPEDVFKNQCEELDAYKEIGTLEEVRDAVEKHKWIPCSERLPEMHGEDMDEEGEYYMISNPVLVTDGNKMYVAEYEEDDGYRCGWHSDNGEDYEGIIAWMPLPAPYRPNKCHGCFGAANNDCERCMDGNEK